MNSIALFLMLITTAVAYQQQLIFHEKTTEDGLFHEFHASVPDATLYPGITKVQRVCVRGMWIVYMGLNYTDVIETDHSYGSSPLCFNDDFAQLPVLSFRHVGAPTTDISALSLYEGEFQVGSEFLQLGTTYVTGNETLQVQSLALTGDANWWVYENSDFTGNSACVGVGRPYDGFFVVDSIQRDLNLSNIRSATLGCGV